MPLIPGKLPPGTCYGTPQQLLEIFSQHLSVTGTDQGVLYTTTAGSAPVVVDPLEPTPRLWVERTVANCPVLYAYGGTSTQNWVQVGPQTLSKTFTASLLSGSPTSEYCFELFTLPAKSVIHWIACRTSVKFTKGVNNCTLKVRLDPNENFANPFINNGTPTGTQLGGEHNLYPDATNATKPAFLFAPNVDTVAVPYETNCFLNYSAPAKLWVEIGPVSSEFTAGSATVWVNYSQLQG